MGKLKRLVFHKQKGNVTSFFIGIMFIMLIMILMLIALRTVMVSESMYFIDDALTGSVLGGATANEMEYGRSNQILLQNTDEAGYITYDSASKQGYVLGDNTLRQGWEQKEADILVSELNYKSTILAKAEYLPAKMIKDLSDTGVRQIKHDDAELIDNIESMLNILHINLTNSNGDVGTDSRFTGLLDSDTQLLSLYTNSIVTNEKILNALTITEDEMSKSLLNEYVVSDVKVTRLEVYNIFRQTFAERHVYASENMLYKIVNKQTGASKEGLTYEDLKNNRTLDASKQIVALDSTTNSILNDSRYDIYVKWQPSSEYVDDDYKKELREQRLKKDLEFFNGKITSNQFTTANNGYILADSIDAICFTDTAVTYQQAYDANKRSSSGAESNYYINNREYYGFMYPMNINYNNADNTITIDNVETVDEAAVQIMDSTYRLGQPKLRSAIEGYTVYSYVLNNCDNDVSSINQRINHNNGKYIDLSNKSTPVGNLVLGCFKNSISSADIGDKAQGRDTSKIEGSNHDTSKAEGGKIYNTTVYLEITFTMSTFGEIKSLFQTGDMGKTQVTIGRLVEIDPYYEEE